MSKEICMASTSGGDDSQSAPPTCPHEGDHNVDLQRLIKEDLAKLPPDVNKPCIFKIPQKLRQLNPKAYTPFRVSIGPYHANDEELKSMEPYKLRCLKSLMSENALERYIQAIESRESDARRCYSGIENLDSLNFKRMLLLDGAFIVAFLCRDFLDSAPMCLGTWDSKMNTELNQDLLLLENQLPFFILEDLFEITFKECPHVFPGIAYRRLSYLCPFRSSRHDDLSLEQVQRIASQGTVIHLLHLIRMCFCLATPVPSSLNETSQTPCRSHLLKQCIFGIPNSCISQRFHYLGSKMKNYWGRKEEHHRAGRKNIKYSLERLPATELHEVGIKFRAKKGHPMYVEFDEAEGVFEMSYLLLTGYTETFFRNVIAYEQYYLYELQVTSYMSFMSRLIRTEKDLDILEASQLIYSIFNSKEDAAAMFNNITKYNASQRAQKYKEVYKKLTTYTTNPWKKWKAMLYRDYFGSPWAIISFVAAALLLALTAVQTFAALKWH